MPLLELHIPPPPPPTSSTPAYHPSLPTLDPESLALIAYFSLAIPRGEWSLIPSLPGANPTGVLPALKWGDVWVGGWGNAIDFVGKMGGEEWALGGREEGDNGRGKGGRGDVIAFSNFIRSKGRTLLDLSLFASRANYDALTRPALASALPFPLSWLEPRRLREAALARTAHLGIKLDGDDKDDAAAEGQVQGEDVIPASLRKDNTSAASASIAAEGAATIRLSALADEFLEPLSAMRGEGRWFVGGRATEVDCLALGYLAVMLVDGLPRPWLAAKVRAVKGLKEWVGEVEGVAFEELPWGEGEGGVGVLGRAVGGWVRGALGMGGVAREEPKEEEFLSESEREVVAYRARVRRREMWVSTGSVVVGVGLFVGFLFQQGIVAAVMKGAEGRARDREEEVEEDGPWEVAEPGLAALAAKMNF
ncbi:hypothetical protein VE03_06867 [Pseudogymnoascus sp. 23342-1-I1]|nr:hypothetical protein VE03_06867 [Pseudogymnoascus sp. 23342-1-I1]